MSIKFGKVHSRKHAINSTSDHTADANKLFASDSMGTIIEIPNGASNTVLTSTGPNTPPSWQLASSGAIPTTAYNTSYTVLVANVAGSPTALQLAENTILGRVTGGGLAPLTPPQIRGMINVQEGAAPNPTPVQILNEILPIDGTGSGLDADLLDGHQATDFLLANPAIPVQSTSAMIYAGTGSPAGIVTAHIGSLYLRTDGGTGTTLYVKETGTGTSGWVAK